jgi:tetratricopeptide (TPR) repeat protein
VGQLSGKTSTELVRAVLEAGDVAPELKELVLGRAAGNPLFIEELTQSLLENGSIEERENMYVLTRKVSDIRVPETIQAIIAARIDRIDDSMKQVIQMAAVIGREFAFRILQYIMEMKADLKSTLLNLQGLEFIHEKQLFPELEFIFKHALTQEVAYNSLLQKRRKEIHEKIGKAIEALYPDRLEEYYELLAYHYRHGESQDKAFIYLDLANRKAAKLCAMKDAMAYFYEAMHVLDSLPNTDENQARRVSIIVHNYEVFQLQFMNNEYYQLLKNHENTVLNLKQPEMLGKYYARLGQCGWFLGQHELAIQASHKAIKLCDAIRNAEYSGIAYSCMQWCYTDKGNYEKALTLKEKALKRLDQHFNLRIYQYVLTGALQAHRYRGQWKEAISDGRKALKAAEGFSNNSAISFASMMIAYVYLNKLDISHAIQSAKYAIDKAPTPAEKAWAQTALAAAWLKTGEVEKGLQILAPTAQMYEDVDYILGLIWIKTYLCEAYWLNGMHDDAKQTIEELLDLAKHYEFRFYIASAHRMLGEFLLTTNIDQASEHFKNSIAIAEEIKAENELALSYAGYGRYYRQKGDMIRAREYLTKALDMLDHLGTLVEPDKIRAELSELP